MKIQRRRLARQEWVGRGSRGGFRRPLGGDATGLGDILAGDIHGTSRSSSYLIHEKRNYEVVREMKKVRLPPQVCSLLAGEKDQPHPPHRLGPEEAESQKADENQGDVVSKKPRK